MSETVEEANDRYLKACHAVQSGVAWKMRIDGAETEPKHLRVGVNSSLVSVSAVVKLLVAKGVFTLEEYMTALADATEEEAQLYADYLTAQLGTKVELS